jgi:hypothetical protein
MPKQRARLSENTLTLLLSMFCTLAEVAAVVVVLVEMVEKPDVAIAATKSSINWLVNPAKNVSAPSGV